MDKNLLGKQYYDSMPFGQKEDPFGARRLWLPDLENLAPPIAVVEPNNRSLVAAPAWDAPRLAFGSAGNSSGRVFDLVAVAKE